MKTTETKPKILVEFSMAPECKAELQVFLDANFEALKRGDKKVKLRLQEVIKRTFPREKEPGQVGSLEELQKILKGESEYALLIRNCPERRGFADMKKDELKSENTYSYYLGKALYEMFDAQSLQAETMVRSNNARVPKMNALRGRQVHRDLMVKPSMFFGKGTQARYVMFSCPINDEHAVTEIIHLRRAIENMSPAMRKKTEIEVWLGRDHIRERLSLDTVLQYLTYHTDPEDPLHVRKLFVESFDQQAKQWGQTAPELIEAIKPFSKKIDLQPGDFMVWDEHVLFHKGHLGDAQIIENIPKSQGISRFLIHHTGISKH